MVWDCSKHTVSERLDPDGSEMLLNGSLLALAGLNAWIATVVWDVSVQKIAKGSMQNEYGDIFGNMFSVATIHLVGTVHHFLEYGGQHELCNPTCLNHVENWKQGGLIINRGTIVLQWQSHDIGTKIGNLSERFIAKVISCFTKDIN